MICGTVKSLSPLTKKLEARESHVEAFGALAHVTRLQAFFHLVRARREVPAGEIQRTLAVPGPRCLTTWISSVAQD